MPAATTRGPLNEKEKAEFDSIGFEDIRTCKDVQKLLRLEAYMRDGGFCSTADVVVGRLRELGQRTANAELDPAEARALAEEQARMRAEIASWSQQQRHTDVALAASKEASARDNGFPPVRAPLPSGGAADVAPAVRPSAPAASAKPAGPKPDSAVGTQVRSGREYYERWERKAAAALAEVDREEDAAAAAGGGAARPGASAAAAAASTAGLARSPALTERLLSLNAGLSPPERALLSAQEKAKGNEHFRAKEYEAAVEHYTLALGLRGAAGEASLFSNRAAAYVKLRMWDAAEADASAALEAEPGAVKALLRRAVARMELGRPAEALADCDAALAAAPDSREARDLRAKAAAAAEARGMRRMAIEEVDEDEEDEEVEEGSGKGVGVVKAAAPAGDEGQQPPLPQQPQQRRKMMVVEESDSEEGEEEEVVAATGKPKAAGAAPPAVAVAPAAQAAATAAAVSAAPAVEPAAAPPPPADASICASGVAPAPPHPAAPIVPTPAPAPAIPPSPAPPAPAAASAPAPAAQRPSPPPPAPAPQLPPPPPAPAPTPPDVFDAAVERIKLEGNEAFKAGNFVRAAQLYSEALGLAPDKSILYLNRSMASLKSRLPAKALQDACLAVALDPGSFKALHKRGKAKQELRLWESSREDLQRVLAMMPPGDRNRRDVAQDLADVEAAVQAAAERAEARVAAAAAAQPRVTSYTRARVVIEEHEDEPEEDEADKPALPPDEAARWEADALQQLPELRAAGQARRQEWLAARDAEAAEAHRREMLAWEAAAERAQAAAAAAEAEVETEAAASAAPPAEQPPAADGRAALEALKEEGNAHLKAKRWADAEAAYAECLRRDPAYVVAHLNMTLLLNSTGRYAEAEAEANRTLEMLESGAASVDAGAAAQMRSKALHRRGVARRGLGRLEAALEDLRSVKQLLGQSPQVDEEMAELGRMIAEARVQTASPPPPPPAPLAAQPAAAVEKAEREPEPRAAAPAPAGPGTATSAATPAPAPAAPPASAPAPTGLATSASAPAPAAAPAPAPSPAAAPVATSAAAPASGPASGKAAQRRPIKIEEESDESEEEDQQVRERLPPASSSRPPPQTSDAAAISSQAASVSASVPAQGKATAAPSSPAADAAPEPTAAPVLTTPAKEPPAAASTTAPAAAVPATTQPAPPPVPAAVAADAGDADEAARLREEGNRLYAVGNYVRAGDFYTRSIAACAHNPAAYCNRAFINLHLKRPADALLDAEAALEQAGGVYPKAQLRRALALRDLGRLDDAENELRKLLAAAPGDPALQEELRNVQRLAAAARSGGGAAAAVKPPAQAPPVRHKITVQEVESDDEELIGSSKSGGGGGATKARSSNAAAAAPPAAKGSLAPVANGAAAASSAPASQPAAVAAASGSPPTTAAAASLHAAASAKAAAALASKVPKRPRPPQNAHEFEQGLKSLAGHPAVLHDFVRSLDPGAYASVIKANLSTRMVAAIVAAAKHGMPQDGVQQDPAAAAATEFALRSLEALTLVPRFEMTYGMVAKEAKEDVRDVVGALAAAGRDVALLKKSYRL